MRDIPEVAEYSQNICSDQIPDARQDMVELYPAASSIINAEWVFFDFDDTLAYHDPEAQYWVALHTLAMSYGSVGLFRQDQFVDNYAHSQQDSDSDELREYLKSIRALAIQHTGDAYSFERVAQAFRDYPNDGQQLKAAIKTIPKHSDTGTFWETRAQLLRAEGVPASFGTKLLPGTKELVSQISIMSKKIGVISNSRADLILPALDELFSEGRHTFTAVTAVGGTGIPIKPARDAYTLLQQQYENLTPESSVYIGNAREDVAFAKNVGMPAVIFGDGWEPGEVSFVNDVAALAHVIRRHTDGASIARTVATTAFAYEKKSDSTLRHDMTPDEVRGMAAHGLRLLWAQQLARSVEAYASKAWSNEYVSLKQVANFADSFGSILGEIRIPQLSTHPSLSSYFATDRIHKSNGIYGLRGPRYFVCVDERYNPTQRMNNMLHELHVALATIDAIDRKTLRPEDLLSYLGVLDNAKQQALTIFHALTYDERRSGIPDNPQYLTLRSHLFEIAVGTTRSFYEACLGRNFTSLPSPSDARCLIDEIGQHGPITDSKRFKIQELDNPLKIMLSAYSVATNAPVETVIGFPSGGTQMAIVTALANELLHDLPPQATNIVSVPLSQHSGTTKVGARPISDNLLQSSVGMFSDVIRGKHVIIVDDNSSTGATMERGTIAIQRQNPASIRRGVCEIDPKRMLVRARMPLVNGRVTGVADLRHDIFKCAAGVAPITQQDIQIRKRFAGRILGLDHRRIETT